ncbi:MAG: response regulator [Clostridiales bacterium]|nr:response regulator [Clostridiales bacterium]
MKLNEKVRNGLIIGVLVAAIVVGIVLYALFVQNTIFTESSNHLSEVYSQTNAQLQQRVESNRNIMRSWESYIKATANSDNPDWQAGFEDFVNEQKKRLNVKRFSFIDLANMSLPANDENKDKIIAMDRDGRQYKLNLRRPAQMLFSGDDAAVACMREYIDGTGIEVINEETGVVEAEVGKARLDYSPTDRYIMIAVRFSGKDNYYTAPGDTHAPFHYDGIAFFFDVETISYAITVNAFDENAACFLVLPNGLEESSKGLVLLSSIGTKNELFNKHMFANPSEPNFLKFLLDNTKMKSNEVAALREDWVSLNYYDEENMIAKLNKDLNGYTVSFKANDGEEYYLNYRTVAFSDWILVGVVPSSIVNRSMANLRTITVVVMTAIFVVMGAGVAWFIVMSGRRKMREQEVVIKSREKLFDQLTMNSDDIFALFNAKTGEAEYVSQNVETVLGISAEEAKKNVYTLMSAAVEDVGELSKFSPADMDEGVVVEELLMKNLKNNNEYWFRLGINPTQHGNYVLMLSDRTRDRQMRADLEAALNIAKTANEAKSNFLSNMSHDIRTPMNAIIGFATLLEKDVENVPKVREYIRKISHSSHHMLSLINDILDMSKIESGKSALHVAEFSLPELMEELYSIIITQVNAKKQTFEMRTKGNIPELVYGDKLRLNQVMINLLSNAVKYTPAGGKIELTVEALKQSIKNHAHLRFSVKDNGLGMSEEFVKVIFEPFSRETTAATREIQGTGLGMAITKQIVDLMGGTITVKSKRDEGSEFIVEIELAKVTKSHADNPEFWKQHNINKMLVVDDEADVGIEVKELMRDTGVAVDCTTSGKEALERINAMKNGETKYDIVLLDWKMPGMDGLEVAKQIRHLVSPDLPIMFLTSYNFEEIEDEAKETGIQAFLPKPFFVSNFRNAVAKLSEEEEEEQEEEQEYSLDGLNILAAEDNPINAEILIELLDIEGAKCTIAENGQLAVEAFEKSEPGTYDMIFMDVQMPVMNGHDASRAIRNSSHPEAKTIPIIAMTANAFDDDKKMARDAGMNAHVAKPIDMVVLKKTVANVMGGRNE